jgi:hypothetical protein
MALEIKTATELIALDMEGRQAARRAARETDLLRRVFRAFVDRAGSVQVDEIVAAIPDQAPERVLEAGRTREGMARGKPGTGRSGNDDRRGVQARGPHLRWAAGREALRSRRSAGN